MRIPQENRWHDGYNIYQGTQRVDMVKAVKKAIAATFKQHLEENNICFIYDEYEEDFSGLPLLENERYNGCSRYPRTVLPDGIIMDNGAKWRYEDIAFDDLVKFIEHVDQSAQQIYKKAVPTKKTA